MEYDKIDNIIVSLMDKTIKFYDKNNGTLVFSKSIGQKQFIKYNWLIY